MILAIRNLMDGLLEEGISIRAMPCGDERPECSFTGTLLPRSEYIDPERSAIFGRLGVRPSEWTVVGIISRIPTAPAESSVVAPEGFTRANLETMVIELLAKIESLGFSGSATWPSIGIIPIAVYRPLIPSDLPSLQSVDHRD